MIRNEYGARHQASHIGGDAARSFEDMRRDHGALRIYDVGLDEFRDATQQDIDMLMACATNFGWLRQIMRMLGSINKDELLKCQRAIEEIYYAQKGSKSQGDIVQYPHRSEGGQAAEASGSDCAVESSGREKAPEIEIMPFNGVDPKTDIDRALVERQKLMRKASEEVTDNWEAESPHFKPLRSDIR